MRNRRFYKPVLGCLVLVFLCCTSAVQTSMNKSRVDMELTRVTPLENAPPALVFTTVALGGFRGLISNVLWMRANKLQEESKFFEMVQLADWITKLQPHYSQVWRIQAWNMTYNISVKFPNRDDKWHWIMSGVKLLRDEGIQYNPHEPALYEELCYFLYHKMGGTSDLAHLNFKNRWAWEWHNILNLYEVHLVTEGTAFDLPTSGESSLFILKTDKGLHFRVFGNEGQMILDSGEKAFPEKQNEFARLNVNLGRLWEEPALTVGHKAAILGAITAITGLTLQNGNGFPDYGSIIPWKPRMADFPNATAIPRTGINEVIVARITNGVDNSSLHFRVFDGAEKMVLDFAAEDLESRSAELAELRVYLEPLWDKDKLSENQESEFLDHALVFLSDQIKIIPQSAAAIESERTMRKLNKMDVRLMKTVDEKYGPLDWRLPETHAIYWAMDGMRKAHAPSVLPLRRIIYQSMQLASRRGKVIENKALGKLEFGPNVRIIPKANATYLQMMTEDPERIEHISQGHRNFLFRAVRDLYLNGQREDADTWFQYGKEVYEDFIVMEGDDIDTFVLWNLGEDLNALNPDDFHNMIKGFIQTAYYDMARGEESGYQGRIATAKLVRDKYMYWIKNPGMKNIFEGRVLPELYEIETEVLKELFDPESNIHLELLAVWETRVPNLDARLGRTSEDDKTVSNGKSAGAARPGSGTTPTALPNVSPDRPNTSPGSNTAKPGKDVPP